jgi:similar to stage IV sporulation protein
MRTLFDFLSGCVFVEIDGMFPERFFNICRSRKIPLYEIGTKITEQGTVYVAKMKIRDYRKVRNIAKKTKCIPKIRRRIGLPFLLQKYRSRLMFAAGSIYAVWLLWLLSCFVWDISVEGGFVHTEEELIAYLQEQSVACGMRKRTLDCTELERQIRMDYPDIGWVSAELLGTRLIVRIAETQMPLLQGKEAVPVHLVATADGIVEKLVLRKGTALVKPGDVVRKGDILVSGVVTVTGDNDTILNRYGVAAEADILLKTVKHYNHSFDRVVTKQLFTKEKKTGVEISFGNRKIFSHMPSHSYTNYAIITEDAVLSLHEHFPLPVRMKKTRIYFYEPVNEVCSEEEARAVADAAYLRYETYLNQHDTKVLEKNLSTTVGNATVKTQGKLILLSAAWEEVPVQENEWRLQKTDEYNGNNDAAAGGA